MSFNMIRDTLGSLAMFTAKRSASFHVSSIITKHFKKRERVRIASLGILQVRNRAAHMGRNAAAGEAIKIKASKKIASRADKDLKMVV
jgi:nucleoid DNA-binding protein